MSRTKKVQLQNGQSAGTKLVNLIRSSECSKNLKLFLQVFETSNIFLRLERVRRLISFRRLVEGRGLY